MEMTDTQTSWKYSGDWHSTERTDIKYQHKTDMCHSLIKYIWNVWNALTDYVMSAPSRLPSHHSVL